MPGYAVRLNANVCEKWPRRADTTYDGTADTVSVPHPKLKITPPGQWRLRPATAPRTLAIGLLERIAQFLGELPTQALDPPTLFFIWSIWRVESRLSTLDPRNEKTASSLDPPPEGREVKRAESA